MLAICACLLHYSAALTIGLTMNTPLQQHRIVSRGAARPTMFETDPNEDGRSSPLTSSAPTSLLQSRRSVDSSRNLYRQPTPTTQRGDSILMSRNGKPRRPKSAKSAGADASPHVSSSRASPQSRSNSRRNGRRGGDSGGGDQAICIEKSDTLLTRVRKLREIAASSNTTTGRSTSRPSPFASTIEGCRSSTFAIEEAGDSYTAAYNVPAGTDVTDVRVSATNGWIHFEHTSTRELGGSTLTSFVVSRSQLLPRDADAEGMVTTSDDGKVVVIIPKKPTRELADKAAASLLTTRSTVENRRFPRWFTAPRRRKL